MKSLRLLGATWALSLAPTVAAQLSIVNDGSMYFFIGDAHWAFLASSYTPETNNPVGFVLGNGTTLVATATSNGDNGQASGTAKDTVAGGNRLSLTATAMGVHVSEWQHLDNELGRVGLEQFAQIQGNVTVQNSMAAAAALGWCEASSNIASPVLVTLLGSAASSTPNALGDLSGAYAGIAPQTPIVSVGNGTYGDYDSDGNSVDVCTDYLFVQHRSRSYVKVLALRSATSPGDALGTGFMWSACFTNAFLEHCLN